MCRSANYISISHISRTKYPPPITSRLKWSFYSHKLHYLIIEIEGSCHFFDAWFAFKKTRSWLGSWDPFPVQFCTALECVILVFLWVEETREVQVDQTLPLVGSGILNPWIILKTILCLVLDSQADTSCWSGKFLPPHLFLDKSFSDRFRPEYFDWWYQIPLQEVPNGW